MIGSLRVDIAADSRLRRSDGRRAQMPASFFPTDPDENAASLVNVAEVLFGCLDAAGARSVAEVGAFHGKSTHEMLGWARGAGARVLAIDPRPSPPCASSPPSARTSS